MKKHIFIIEDEDDIRECLREFLETEGYLVSTAVNGADAFQVGATIPKPDLILLDVMMPIMSGDEFILQQRAKHFLEDVPVVLLSADNQTSKVAASLGVADHLKKPMDLDDLVTIVQKNILKNEANRHASSSLAAEKSTLKTDDQEHLVNPDVA